MCASSPSRGSLALLLLAALLPACSGPEYSRAAEDPEINDPALSTRLDSKDIDLALSSWVSELARSEFVKGLPPGRPGIAILVIENATSEHIAGALDTLLAASASRPAATSAEASSRRSTSWSGPLPCVSSRCCSMSAARSGWPR